MDVDFATYIGHTVIKPDPVIVRYGKRICPPGIYMDTCLFISSVGMAYTYPYYHPLWFSRSSDVWIGYLDRIFG